MPVDMPHILTKPQIIFGIITVYFSFSVVFQRATPARINPYQLLTSLIHDKCLHDPIRNKCDLSFINMAPEFASQYIISTFLPDSFSSPAHLSITRGSRKKQGGGYLGLFYSSLNDENLSNDFSGGYEEKMDSYKDKRAANLDIMVGLLENDEIKQLKVRVQWNPDKRKPLSSGHRRKNGQF